MVAGLGGIFAVGLRGAALSVGADLPAPSLGVVHNFRAARCKVL